MSPKTNKLNTTEKFYSNMFGLKVNKFKNDDAFIKKLDLFFNIKFEEVKDITLYELITKMISTVNPEGIEGVFKTMISNNASNKPFNKCKFVDWNKVIKDCCKPKYGRKIQINE